MRPLAGFILCISVWSSTLGQDLEKLSKGEDLFSVGGSLNVGQIFQNRPNQDFSYSYFLHGNLSLDISGYQVPLHFSYSNRQVSFQQPFNQFSLAPTYKQQRFQLGWSNLSFSPYSLSGHRFLGGATSLAFGNWKVDVMGGRLQRLVLSDSLGAPMFDRYGYGLRVGHTWSNGDLLSVSFFRAWDLKPPVFDVFLRHNVLPADNLIPTLTFSKHLFTRLSVSGEIAASYFTQYSDLEQLPASIHPAGFPASSTGYDRLAYHLQLQYQLSQNLSMGFRHQTIQPDYQNIGTYFMLNDQRNQTVFINGVLFKSLSFNLNTGHQTNNLWNGETDINERWVTSGNLQLQLGKGNSMGVNFSNFNQISRYNPIHVPIEIQDPSLFLDSLHFAQVSRQAGLNAVFQLGSSKKVNRSLILAGNYQQSGLIAEGQMGDMNDNYFGNISFSQFWQPKKVSLSLSASGNIIRSGNEGQVYVGPNISLQKAFKKKGANIHLSLAYNKNQSNLVTSDLLNSRLGFTFLLASKHQLSGQYGGIYRFHGENENHFNQNLTVNYNFHF